MRTAAPISAEDFARVAWVLDPHTLTLRAYERNRHPVLVRDTETVSAEPHVPGFTCSVAAFFQD